MPTDRALMKQQESAALTSVAGITNPIDEVAKAHSTLYSFTKASDDAMANTATSETYTGIYIPYACKVRQVRYVATTGGVTADASNNAVVTVSKRDSAAANLTTIATLTTNVALGNITQGAGVAATNSTVAGATSISAGSTITFSIAKGGSGVVFRAGVFTLELESV